MVVWSSLARGSQFHVICTVTVIKALTGAVTPRMTACQEVYPVNRRLTFGSEEVKCKM